MNNKKIEVNGVNGKKKEVRYIIDVPKSFIEYCYNNTNLKENKKELKEILKQYK